MLATLAVAGYRSLRELVLPLARLNLVTGANGSGKSSLYRSLRLLAETAQGGLVASLAREGGLPSTLWAGPERFSRAMLAGRQPVQGTVRQEAVPLPLGFAAADFGYAIDLGLPQRGASAFGLDPEIKRECIWAGPVFRPAARLVDRRGPALRTIDEAGAWASLPQPVPGFESMLTAFADPRSAPEMLAVRARIRSWRFYDHVRTDPDAPARRPQIGTHTPVLAQDGADLAAAVQTIREIGDGAAFDRTIADAFPGAAVAIRNEAGRFELAMTQPGLLRPLAAAELSDGTLRYLLLAAALLSPRPPSLLVLNEPETSLHPDLLPALARLIAEAATRSQLLLVTHSAPLVAALAGGPDTALLRLEKELGATRVAGATGRDAPRWQWPGR